MSLQNNQRLVDETALKWSMMALRLTVLADTMVSYLLLPSYAIIVDNEAHPESFPSTAPFDFSTATYFIPMMQLVGVAISSSFTGVISDKVGRKPVILFCIVGSMIGCIVKWFCRKSFWAFSIAHLFSGMLSGSLPVALAFISDVFESKTVKDNEFGKTIALYVLGTTFGGLFAVVMYPQGLFAPLWAGVGLMFLVLCINVKFLIEPNKLKEMPKLEPLEIDDEETQVLKKVNDDNTVDEFDEPKSIDKGTMAVIIMGSFADIFGSKSLFPMCLSPLACKTHSLSFVIVHVLIFTSNASFFRATTTDQIFYKNLIEIDQSPIMSINAFQWLGVFLGLLVGPAAIISPKIFQRIGLASGCIVGNVVTGLLTMALLLITNIKPASNLTFGFFIVSLYAGFPFTVLSQLSTSPMLDRISPADQRGLVQGIYTTFYNLAGAVSPWLLGVLADSTSTNTMIWVGVGINFAGGLINAPLYFQERFGPSKKEAAPSSEKDSLRTLEDVWDEMENDEDE